MSLLPTFTFDIKKCISELDEFSNLLLTHNELSEKTDILPFFKSHPQLSAYIGSIFPYISSFDKLKHEHTIYQNFRCDLAIGDSAKSQYCFVEFEDAREKSIFIKGARTTPDWAPRFEKGYSQIIDWFWKIDEMKSTNDFRRTYGDDCTFYGLLIIGRRKFLDQTAVSRMKWRQKNVVINSSQVYCMTFDDLCDGLLDKISPLRLLP